MPHKTLKVTCPKCSAEIDFNCDKYIGKQALAKTINLLLITTFLITYIALPFLFKFKTDSTIAHLNKKHEDEKTQFLGVSFEWQSLDEGEQEQGREKQQRPE